MPHKVDDQYRRWVVSQTPPLNPAIARGVPDIMARRRDDVQPLNELALSADLEDLRRGWVAFIADALLDKTRMDRHSRRFLEDGDIRSIVECLLIIQRRLHCRPEIQINRLGEVAERLQAAKKPAAPAA